MKKREHKTSNRMQGQFSAKNTIDSGYDFDKNRPITIEKVSTAADWAIGTLELKREYNGIVGRKFFDEHTGALLIKMEYIPGYKPRKKARK